MTALAARPKTPGTGETTAWGVLAPLLTAGLAAVGIAAIYLLFVRTALGQVVDEDAMRGAEVEHPRLIAVLNVTLDGTSLVSLALVAILAAAIGVVRGRPDLAVAAGILVLGANLTTQALKAELSRPVLDDSPAPNSFPSGHTTAAVAVAFALVLVLPYATRAAVALAGAAYATVIAVATVWAGWHRPSDTVAALLVCLAWGGIVVAAVRLGRGRRSRTAAGRSVSRLATLPLSVTGMVAAVVGLVGLAAVALSAEAVPGLVSEMAAFLAGSAGNAAAAAGAFLVWLRMVADDTRETATVTVPTPRKPRARTGRPTRAGRPTGRAAAKR